MDKTNRSIALFDLDKTIYSDHSFFGISKYFVDNGLMKSACWDQVQDELDNYLHYNQGFSVTASNLLNIFCKGIKGMEYEVGLNATKEFFALNSDSFYPYFANILPELKKSYAVYLVTTNSQLAAESIKELYGLDGFISSEFEIKNGIFTGVVKSTLANGKGIVDELLSKYSGRTIAVGDSGNDISMLEKVMLPVCINPDKDLMVEAKKKNWLIISDKNAVSEFKKILNNR